jgi:excisionase family DNA binding protein
MEHRVLADRRTRVIPGSAAPAMNPLLLTVGQTAQEINCGRTYVYELLAAGELPKVSLGRATRIPERSVRDFVDRRTRDAMRQREISLDLQATYRRLHSPVHAIGKGSRVG